MKGTMLILRPGEEAPEAIIYERRLELDDLRAGVGGYIEIVPYFNTIGYAGVVMDCIAFCNEYGKIENMRLNAQATMAWDMALKRVGRSLLRTTGQPADYLVGNIIIIFGDKEFMEDFGAGNNDDVEDDQ